MKQNGTADVSSGRSLLFIGPLPPPVHGAAAVNRKVLDALSRRLPILVSNQSPKKLIRGPGYYLRRFYNFLSAVMMVFRNGIRKRPRLYMSIDGGFGSLFNIAVIAVSRLTGHKLVLHHHSFAYINRRSRLLALLTSVAGTEAMHICLSEGMEHKLKRLYPSIRLSMVVPNFISHERSPDQPGRILAGSQITIGHLSNLCLEKGLLEFIALIRTGTCGGRNLKGVLAGPPATNKAARMIESARQELGNALDYRGPVYGKDKDRFFRDIDVFIFPTHYENEAQPIVIAEAMSYGIPVISYDRGCIRDTLSNYMGIVVEQHEDFVSLSAKALADWSNNAAENSYRESNVRFYEDVRTLHHQLWRHFIDDLAS